MRPACVRTKRAAWPWPRASDGALYGDVAVRLAPRRSVGKGVAGPGRLTARQVEDGFQPGGGPAGRIHVGEGRPDRATRRGRPSPEPSLDGHSGPAAGSPRRRTSPHRRRRLPGRDRGAAAVAPGLRRPEPPRTPARHHHPPPGRQPVRREPARGDVSPPTTGAPCPPRPCCACRTPCAPRTPAASPRRSSAPTWPTDHHPDDSATCAVAMPPTAAGRRSCGCGTTTPVNVGDSASHIVDNLIACVTP